MKISTGETGKAISVFCGNFGTTAVMVEECTADGARQLCVDLDRPTALAVAKAIEETAKRKA